MCLEDSSVGVAPEIADISPFCVESRAPSVVDVRLREQVRKRLPCKLLVLFCSRVLAEIDVAESQTTVRIRLEGCDPGVLNIVVIAEARVRNLSGETTTDKEGAADNSGICVQSQLHISAIGALLVFPRACAKEMMHVLDDIVQHAKSSTLPKDDQDSDYLLAKGHEFTEAQDRAIREMLRRKMFRPFAADLDYLLSTSSNETVSYASNPAFETKEMNALVTNMVTFLKQWGAWNTLSYVLRACHNRGANLGKEWMLTPRELKLSCTGQSAMTDMTPDGNKEWSPTQRTGVIVGKTTLCSASDWPGISILQPTFSFEGSDPTDHEHFQTKPLQKRSPLLDKRHSISRSKGLPLQGFACKSTKMEVRTVPKSSARVGTPAYKKNTAMGSYAKSSVKEGTSAFISSDTFPCKLIAALLSTENTSLSMCVASLLMTCGLYMSSEAWNQGSRLMLAGGLFSGLFFCWKKEAQFRLRSSLVWISRITVIFLLFCHGMGWQQCPCFSTCTSGVQYQGGVLQSLFWLFTSASCHQHRVARQLGFFAIEGLASLYSLTHISPGCNGVVVTGLVLMGEIISLLASLSYHQLDKKNVAKNCDAS